jgi:hypothetical protein
MFDFNVDGYKLVFYVENLMRDYIIKYMPESVFPNALINEAELNSKTSEKGSKLTYNEILQFLHIGQLFDVIKSRSFIFYKKNEVGKLSISPLVERRNTIMHSRFISANQFNEIKEICERLVISFKDNEFMSSWNRFISEEIDDYSIPLIYVEYPLGKNFTRLVGRDKELADLKNAIKIPTPVSIVRHGGLGKTAIVLQLVEDLLYSPAQPYERIYFMSFKNSVFENGVIRKLEKVISNHEDLINKLSFHMEIDISGKSFDNIETEVWMNIFSHRTLLVLDNLETEIVQTNLAEFTNIANRFLTNFTNPSRLIITSRYGLGDREQKFPILEFDVDRTKELIKNYMHDREDKLKGNSNEDWEWVQTYTKGNPGLIISFCNSFRTSQKSMLDLRVEFNSKYTMESRQLHDMQDVFLEFCFQNILVSVTRETQIFISALCYLASEANLKEISEELLAFLIDELNFNKLSIQNLRASILVNVGFLQPILGSNMYHVNEMFIDYINGNFADEQSVFTVFSLKNSEWYSVLKQMKMSILDLQDEVELTVGQILSKLYQIKFRSKLDNRLLLKAFLCDSTTKNLVYYFEKSNSVDILNNFNMLDKIKFFINQNIDISLQERIAFIVIEAITNINHQIKQGTVKGFRQHDLFDFFQQIQTRLWIFRTNSISKKLRIKIVDMLIAIFQLDEAEKFLLHNELTMIKVAFELYSRQIGNLVGRDRTRCEPYIIKCQTILSGKNARYVRDEAKALFFVYMARYYKLDNPKLAYKTIDALEALPRLSDTMYSLYLESLLIRAECKFLMKEKKEEIEKLISFFKSELNQPRYVNLRVQKRRSLESSLVYVEKQLRSYKIS